jgi:carbamoyl-phosphate synthase large subunit
MMSDTARLFLHDRSPMKKRNIRALVTGAGTGSSANLMRALRTMTPKPFVVGVNDDRFVLKLSLANRNYLCPEPASNEFVDSLLEIIERERINVIMPTDDNTVKALSDARDRFSIDLLLPRPETIERCQDKYALAVFLRRRNIPAPRTFEVKSLRSLKKIFSNFSRDGLLWCRARRGSRSLAATPVATEEQARAWITQWRDLRGVKVSDFTLGEYLPGRHFIVQSVWHNGNLLRAQSIEVLSYFAAGNNPSGVFSLSCLAKTVVAPEALEVTLKAVRALEQHPSGAFFVELKETADGVPAITEINAGRFPSGVTALLAVGKDNMIGAFASTCVGRPVKIAEPLGSALEYYMVRDIDAVPGVFSAADLLAGFTRVTLPSRAK